MSNPPPARHQPDLLFDVTDEDMAMPLGIVADVAVGSNGVVYLLDKINCNIRRIALTGDLLDPIGRPGMGPGDLNLPNRLAVFSDGRCMVIQDFSRHAACFTVGGDACPPQDISFFRDGVANAIFLRAAAGPDGQLIVSAMTMLRKGATPNASLEERGASASVKRFRPGMGQPEDLFVAQAHALDSNAVLIPAASSGFIIQGWDINTAGEILYGDPSGQYRVSIGHPADGVVKTIDLPEMAGDEQKIKELATLIGGKIHPEDIPHIAALHWLDNEFFMVTPAAEVGPPVADEFGTVEVFSRDGSSYGRFTINCEYDPSNDEMFSRNDILIVVRGGKAVAHATLHDFLPPGTDSAPPAEVYEIRVRAYRLFTSLRALR